MGSRIWLQKRQRVFKFR